MKLRTQILLFLFIFAIAPLITFVVMNLPMVMTKMEFLYNTAYLQNLRAEFRDLDEHLASRHEMIRLLAKLPDQAIVLGEDKEADENTIYTERSHYIQWINSFLGDQFDIIQLVFYGSDGSERFWLDRELKTGVLRPTTERPEPLPEAFLEAREPLQAGQILVSPLSIDPQASSVDPLHYITLRMITPIIDHREGTTLGMIMIRIDVGGIAQRNREVAWVLQNGRFLENLGPWAPKGDAFEQFPGLGDIFEQGKLALWQGDDNRQIMWIPMFQTEQQGTLWIGREVDPSPIELIRNSLTQRMAIFVINLMLLVWLVSIWFARRTSRLGKELIDGVQQVLEEEQEVAFNWSGPAELQQLGRNLSQLAEKYGRNTRDLRAHAEELEASNRYKSQFLANVSHELRTPLNSILLLSKMLADKNSGLSGEQSQQARVIHEAGSDLRALIDNILDLSRIEARRTPIHLEQISPKALLGDLVELMRPQFDARGLSLELEIAPNAPATLYSDPDKIGQIIKNFLANAVKFTEQGGVTLRLEPIESEGNHDYEIAIRVIDTGIGISEKQRSHIFDAFKQADGSTNRRYGGTGLGLSISRGLAHLLGGRIELRSEQGRGSTFSLLLPRVITPEAFDGMDQLEVTSQPAPEKIQSAPVPAAPAHFKGERLLIIGCNTTTLLSIVPIFEKWGLTVTAAEDLAEAQEAIEEEQLSLILLDNNILNKEGHDKLDAILGQSTSELPVLLIVEAGQPHDPEYWAGVLTKPLDMDTLKANLIKILKNDTEVNS